MHIGLIIDRLLSDRKVKKITLYNHLGISKNTLNDYLVGKTSMTIETAQKIADFFNIPLVALFDDKPLSSSVYQTGNGNIIGDRNKVTISDFENRLEISQKEIVHLHELLDEKERTIQILMKKQNNGT